MNSSNKDAGKNREKHEEGLKGASHPNKVHPTCSVVSTNQSDIDAEMHALRGACLLMHLDGDTHIVHAEE
nr:hypothetical protein [Tanacetum cinerariifolium]